MNPISALQLRDYLIESLHVDANPNFKGKDGVVYPSDIGIEFDFKKREDGPLFRIDLEIQLNPTEESYAKAPYRIRIKTQTVLEFEPSFPEKDIPRLLGPNGLAMAYSIARGIVGQATGTSLHGKFILPTVNFVELLKAKSQSAATKKTRSKHQKA